MLNETKPSSTITITTVHTNPPMAVPGSDLPQRNLINIRVSDPKGRVVVDGYMSANQFMTAMMGSKISPILLKHYASGEFKSESAPEVESASDLLSKMLAENDVDIVNATEATIELIEAMQEGHVKANKANLTDLKRAIDRISQHVISNRNYMVDKIHEAVEKKANDISMSLVLQAQALSLPGIESAPVQIASNYKNELLPNPDEIDVTPIDDTEAREPDVVITIPEQTAIATIQPAEIPYQPMPDLGIQIPEVPIEKMTSVDVAKEIHLRLKAIENDPSKNTKKKSGDLTYNTLYMSMCSASRGGVNITYVTYQGSTFVDLDVAKKYLLALRSGFTKCHFVWQHEMEAKNKVAAE